VEDIFSPEAAREFWWLGRLVGVCEPLASESSSRTAARPAEALDEFVFVASSAFQKPIGSSLLGDVGTEDF
jgi:hypothetical protein